ncbi:MAG: ABC transporter permease subunit [Lachnospiraceae bacterium]|nr:ABC transporter permease subunit [Lachnospiraceae bacterium]
MTERENKTKTIAYTAAAVIFWLLVWQVLSVATGSRVILPGPLDALKALFRLIPQLTFWKTVGNSFIHIAAGFLCAVAAGTLLAAASYRFAPVKILFAPLMRLIKAVPVASFIILVLLWINSRMLPAVISFLMVLPVIYTNVLAGIEGTDKKLLEMAEVFRLSRAKRLKYIYIPAVKPHFVSAVNIGLGFSWKSGVAAEVIGLSPNAIGTRLYEAKLYLMTDELFAWTAVIVLVSVAFEKAVMAVLKRAAGKA